MKSYSKSYIKKEKRKNVFGYIIGEMLLMFVIATASIVLYDMYINIDVTPQVSYKPEKVAKEANIENTTNISDMLESVSANVVRNI